MADRRSVMLRANSTFVQHLTLMYVTEKQVRWHGITNKIPIFPNYIQSEK